MQLRTVGHSRHLPLVLDLHQLHYYLPRRNHIEGMGVLQQLPDGDRDISVALKSKFEVLRLMILELFVIRSKEVVWLEKLVDDVQGIFRPDLLGTDRQPH